MEKFIKVLNLEMAYAEVNSDKKDTILFIHGNSNSHNIFKNQLGSPLLSDYRMIAVDLPGHGESSKCYDDDCYTIPWYSKMIMKLTNLSVVGHSLGGHVAIGVSHQVVLKGY